MKTKTKNLALLCTVSLSGVSQLAQAKDPMNILFIISDDQSAKHVGCYGNPDVETPNLDAFAADATRFERGYVTCPQSAPSRKSILTGRSPVALQATRFTAPLHKDVVTFPEILAKECNYYTGLTGRTHHLDLESYKNINGKPNLNAETVAYIERNNLNTAASRFDVCLQVAQKDGGGEKQIAQWKSFMNERPKDRPFFAQICFTDPHRVYTAPKHHDPLKLTLPPTHPETQAVRADLAAYYDEIYRLDQSVGIVLDYLKENKLYDNTLIVFLGDNGGAQFMGKGTLYEGGINVPYIVRHPKYGHGKVYSDVVSTEDLAPTCLEMNGIEVPENMTGESLLKVFRGGERKDKYVYAERGAHAFGRVSDNNGLFDLQRCIVSKQYKLIFNAMPMLKNCPVDFGYLPIFKELEAMHKKGQLSDLHSRLYFYNKKPVVELFDLEKDPNEFVNVAENPAYREIHNQLLEQLGNWMVRERDFLPTVDYLIKR